MKDSENIMLKKQLKIFLFLEYWAINEKCIRDNYIIRGEHITGCTEHLDGAGPNKSPKS